MKLPISNRLLACCSYVSQNDRVADVGTDHGYLGIHLLLNGIAGSVIASDINEMPLRSAQRNAEKFGVQNRMTFFLSDGVQNIPRDFNVLVCAGMGADTMIQILKAAPWLKDKQYRLILQCQSRRPELRRWLYSAGFSIRRETLAQDGKFLYPIMEVIYSPGASVSPAGYYLSPALLENGSPLLPTFYDRVVASLRTTVAGLSRSGGETFHQYKAILEALEEMEETVYGNRG